MAKNVLSAIQEELSLTPEETNPGASDYLKGIEDALTEARQEKPLGSESAAPVEEAPEAASDYAQGIESALDSARGEGDYSFLGRTAAGIARAPVGLAEGAVGGVQAMGRLVGADLSSTLEPITKRLEETRKILTPYDPNLYDEFVEAASSMATFLIPGLGASVAAGKAATMVPRLAQAAPRIGALLGKLPGAAGDVAKAVPYLQRLFGSGVMTALESMTEAGQSYLDMLKEGYDPDEAAKRSAASWAANASLLAVTNKWGIFSEVTGPGVSKLFTKAGAKAGGRRLLQAGTSEGLQEAGQEVISEVVPAKSMAEIPERIKPGQVAKAGLMGAAVGGPASVLLGHQPREQAPPSPVAAPTTPGVAPTAAPPQVAPTAPEAEPTEETIAPEEPKRATTQLDLPQEMADVITEATAGIPPEAMTAKGLEKNPHVTVMYGLHGDNPEDVKKAVAGHGPIQITLGDLGVFKNPDEDILYIKVESPEIDSLRGKVGTLPNTQTNPEYVPHVTLAHLLPGSGDQWIEGDNASVFSGMSIPIENMTFSTPDGATTQIDLTEPAPAPEKAPEAKVEKAPEAGVEKAPETAVAVPVEKAPEAPVAVAAPAAAAVPTSKKKGGKVPTPGTIVPTQGKVAADLKTTLTAKYEAQWYKDTWAKIQKGEIKEGGKPSMVLAFGKELANAGIVKTAEDLRAPLEELNKIRAQKLPQKKFQKAVRDLYHKYRDAAKTEAKPALKTYPEGVHTSTEDVEHARVFAANRDLLPDDKKAYVTSLSPEEIAKDYTVITSHGGKAGVLLRNKDKYMGNAYRVEGAPPGATSALMIEAIKQGGRVGDAFDGVLPALYAQLGMKTVGHMKFDPDLAPQDPALLAKKPDLVILAWDGFPESEEAILARVAGPKENWRAPEQFGPDIYWYSKGQYGLALEAARAASEGRLPKPGETVQDIYARAAKRGKPVLQPAVEGGAGAVQPAGEGLREGLRPGELPAEQERGGPTGGVGPGERAGVPGEAGAGPGAELVSTIRDLAKSAADSAAASARALEALRADLAEVRAAKAPAVTQEPAGAAEAVKPEAEKALLAAPEGFENLDEVVRQEVAEAERRHHGLTQRLLMRVDTPKKGVLKREITPKNAAKSEGIIRDLLYRHPDALFTPETWGALMTDMMGGEWVPAYPSTLGKYYNYKKIAVDFLFQQKDHQLASAAEGINRAVRIRQLIRDGKWSTNRTADMLLWGMLSRRATPFVQESAFIDAKSRGMDFFVQLAVDGKFDSKAAEKWALWSTRVSGKGTGLPGASVTNSLLDFGRLMLARIGVPNENGIIPLHYIHHALVNSQTAHEFVMLTRAYLPEGSGVDNKILNFIALVTGLTDGIPIDVVETNHMWGPGSYSIIEGKTEAGLVNVLQGGPGIVINKVWSDALGSIAPDVISDLNVRLKAAGRPTFDAPATAGTLHWAIWNGASFQAATHGSMAGVEGEVLGVSEPYSNLWTDLTKYGLYKTGAIYGRPEGHPVIRYPGPGGTLYEFTPKAFSEAMEAIKDPSTGVRPKGFLISEITDKPFWEDPRIDRERLHQVLSQFGVEISGGPGGYVAPREYVPGAAASSVDSDIQAIRQESAAKKRVVSAKPIRGKTMVAHVKALPKNDQHNAQAHDATFQALARIDDARVATFAAVPFAGAPKAVRTLGHSFRNDLIVNGHIDLRGQTVNSMEDYAEVGQITIDPGIESVRLAATNDQGRIIWQQTISSHLPSTTSGLSARQMIELNTFLKSIGAKKLFSMHNHTSGVPTPSSDDVNVVAMMAEHIEIFQGEVVIEGGRYGTILPDGTIAIRDLKSGVGAIESAIKTPSVSHGMLGSPITSIADVAFLGKSLSSGKNAALVYADINGKIRGLQTMSVDELLWSPSRDSWLQDQKKYFGSRYLWVWFGDNMSEMAAVEARRLIATGKIWNFGGRVMQTPVSGAGTFVPASMAHGEPVVPNAIRLAEGTQSKDQAVRQAAFRKLMAEIEARRAAGRFKLIPKIPEGLEHQGPPATPEPELPLQTDLQAVVATADFPDIQWAPEDIEKDDLGQTVLNLPIHRKILDAAGALMKVAGVERDPHRRISDQIMDMIKDKKIDGEQIKAVREKYGLSHDEMALVFRGSVTESAVRLGTLAYLANQVGKFDPETQRLIRAISTKANKIAEPQEVGWITRLDRIRRLLQITQIGNAVRNFYGQVGRIGVDVLNVGLQRTIQGIQAKVMGVDVKNIAHPSAPMYSLVGLLWNSGRGTLFKSPKTNQAIINNIATHFPSEARRLSNSLFSGLAQKPQATKMGRFMESVFGKLETLGNIANYVNRWQEWAIMSGAFQATLAAKMAARGQNLAEMIRTQKGIDTINPIDITAAVDNALEMAFARKPAYGTFGADFIRMVNKAPFLLTGPIPYPRFLVEAVRYNFEFSPLGFLGLLNKTEIKNIANGDVQKLSKAITGSALLAMAYAIRSLYKDDDEPWYALRIPGTDQRLDLRLFNPYMSYFFAADVIHRAMNGTLHNLDKWAILQGVLGVQPGSLVAIAAVEDLLRFFGQDPNPDVALKGIQNWAGGLMSGFTVPFRNIQDTLAGVSDHFRPLRDTYNNPLFGPAMQNVPGLAESMPERIKATGTEPVEKEHPWLRLLGVPLTPEANVLEQELVRHGFSPKEILPTSGIPLWDRAMKEHMSELSAERLIPFVTGQHYLSLPLFQQGEALHKAILRTRDSAYKRSKLDEPDLEREVKLKRQGYRSRFAAEERAGER